jgi:hypothetical protein
MSIKIPPISKSDLEMIQIEVQDESVLELPDWQVQSMINRIRQLEDAVSALLKDVVPYVHDTGHNAADREMHEAINAARAAVSH